MPLSRWVFICTTDLSCMPKSSYILILHLQKDHFAKNCHKGWTSMPSKKEEGWTPAIISCCIAVGFIEFFRTEAIYWHWFQIFWLSDSVFLTCCGCKLQECHFPPQKKVARVSRCKEISMLFNCPFSMVGSMHSWWCGKFAKFGTTNGFAEI